MHRWGDANVDWQGINNAAEFIAIQLRRWGRIHVLDAKEKWGTVRVYVEFSENSILRFYQELIYKRVYRRAISKWKHLRKEILLCADYSELLQGL
jgi:hypothetical protein